MNEAPLYISAPLLTTLLIEVIKWAWRKWVVKKPEFDFAPIFYDLTIPFFNLLWGIVLGYAGFGPMISFTWQSLLNWGIAIVVTLVLYNAGIKPLKKYGKEYDLKNN